MAETSDLARIQQRGSSFDIRKLDIKSQAGNVQMVTYYVLIIQMAQEHAEYKQMDFEVVWDRIKSYERHHFDEDKAFEIEKYSEDSEYVTLPVDICDVIVQMVIPKNFDINWDDQLQTAIGWLEDPSSISNIWHGNMAYLTVTVAPEVLLEKLDRLYDVKDEEHNYQFHEGFSVDNFAYHRKLQEMPVQQSMNGLEYKTFLTLMYDPAVTMKSMYFLYLFILHFVVLFFSIFIV